MTFVLRPVAVATLALLAGPALAITIGGESRLTEAQFARRNERALADVNKAFAATGQLECGVGRGRIRVTAQLVRRNDVIVTAGHAFADVRTCRKNASPGRCIFRAHDGRRTVTRKVTLLAKGDTGCAAGGGRFAGDWAVLKLAAPIASIVPYDLGELTAIRITTPLVSVSGGSPDFRLGGKPRSDLKTIDSCQIRSVTRQLVAPTLLQTDCDGGMGNSGGALLARHPGDGAYRMLGILIAVPKGGAKGKARQDAPYQTNRWASVGVGLDSEFRAALERATGNPDAKPEVVFSAPAIRTPAVRPVFRPDSTTVAAPPAADSPAVFPPVPGPSCGEASGDCPKP